MLGMHCALRGGVEHNNLHKPGFNPQIIYQRDDRGIERLGYRKDPFQKPNQGDWFLKE